MTRHDPAMMDRITGIAEHWRRCCTGQPPQGMLGHRELRVILAMSAAVAARADGVITWRANGREFTAEPIRDEPTA